MTFPHGEDDEKCIFIHTGIDTLYGVPVMPVDDLPKAAQFIASLDSLRRRPRRPVEKATSAVH